jgi:HptB-dependent secretion and biofilm anti anti-sigma factor
MNMPHGKSVEELKIFGRFDFKYFREFKNMYEPLLHNDSVRTLEINLGGVEYIDSSALGMLLLLREKALKTTKKVVLTHCTESTRDVLDVAHFSQLFEFK